MTDVHGPGGEHVNPDVQHETSDVNIRGILTFCGVLLVVGILIQLSVWGLFQYFTAREARKVAPEYPLATAQESRLPPEPRLQTNPRQDLFELRAREEAILASYGWVDKNKGVVRIPIGEAMKLTLKRGLPTRAGAQETK